MRCPARLTVGPLLLVLAAPSFAAPNPDCLSGFFDAPFSGVRLPGEPYSTVEIDFDRDGDLDIAVASISSRYEAIPVFETVVSFLRREANGTLELDPFVIVEAGPGDLADRSGDFDGDGITDLALAMDSRGEAHIVIHYGLGSGGFDRFDLAADALLQTVDAVISDVNRDGRDDLLCTNYFPASALLLTSRGRRDFEDPQTFQFLTGGGYGKLAAADFNDDGAPDFAYGLGGSIGSIKIRLGRGNEEFDPGPDLDFPSAYLARLTAADLTGDGKVDLAAIGYGDFCDNVHTAEDSTIYIYPGRGDGSFDPARGLVVGFLPADLAIGDLNGDGLADLVVGLGAPRGGICFFARQDRPAGFSATAEVAGSVPLAPQTGFSFGRVASFLAMGDGSLKAAGSYPAGVLGYRVLAAQATCDAQLDVIALDSNQRSLTILSGNGDGSLGRERSYGAGPAPRGAYVADLDRDGRVEAIVANWGGNAVSVCSGLASGSNGRRTDYPAGPGPNSIVAADFDNDTVMDLAVACFGSGDSSSTCESADAGVAILRGDGRGGFEGPRFLFLDGRPSGLAVGDLNRDGRPDLIATLYSGCGGMYALLGLGDLTFAATRIMDRPMPQVWLADVNRDGTPDLIANAHGSPSAIAAVGRGDGSFAASVGLTGVTHVLAVADWNGDGIVDLFGDGTDGAVASMGRGDGTFDLVPAPSPTQDNYGQISGATSADLDGDGHPDLVLWEWAGSTAIVRFGNGDGTFSKAARYAVGWGPSGIAVGDADGDGRGDLVVSNELSHTLAVLINREGTPVMLPAHAFAVGGSRTIPFGCAGADLRCRLQPVAGAFGLDQLDIATLRLVSPNTGRVPSIPALDAKPSRIGDSDGDGISEIEVRFSSGDLAALFSLVDGRATLAVSLLGVLRDGRPIQADFSVTVRGGGCRKRAAVLPNPLNPVGTLSFLTTRPGPVVVRLFDVHGRLVAVPLRAAFTPAGEQRIQLSGVDAQGRRLASGVYVYRIDSPGGSETGRFTILK